MFQVAFLTMAPLITISEARIDFDKEVSLTKRQAGLLKQFKEEVSHLTIPQEYMKDDIYLVKWLRARNFDLQRSLTMFKDHLQWRISKNLDFLRLQDFSEFLDEYPLEVVGEARDGKPLLQFPFDEWNIRKAVVSGKSEKLLMYLMYHLHLSWEATVKGQNEGRNITRFNTILNVHRVSLAEHVNPACIPLYISIVLTYERNFPKMLDEIFLVNTPQVFNAVLTAAKTVMDEETSNSFMVYGTNKAEWQKALFQSVDPSQLLVVFGGSRKRRGE